MRFIYNSIFVFLFFLSTFSFSQRAFVGVYFGPSIGYNSIYDSEVPYLELLDVNFSNQPFSFNVLNDGDLSNNLELFNGMHVGLMCNFVITKGVTIQPEIEYQKLDFNHLVYQNGSAVFNDMSLALSGLYNDGQYKIASYFWQVNYVSFPFLLKLYPSNNLFIQLGFKLGYLVKDKETRSLVSFNNNGEYTSYQLLDESNVYDFFESESNLESHGFDKSQWPFNWNGALIGGLGYESKFFHISLRYNYGLYPFFKEIVDRDNDFFEIYNEEVYDGIYDSFEISTPIINNNFKLQTIHLTFAILLSN